MKRIRLSRLASRTRISVFVALAVTVLLGVGTLVFANTANAGTDAKISISYTDSGDLIVTGNLFDSSTAAKANEVLTAVSLDKGGPLVATTTTNSAGGFTQTFDLPVDYVGSIGIASTTATETATAALVVEK